MTGEVHLWYSRPEAVADPAHLARCETVLSEDERRRHQRFRRDDDRRRFLVAHALLRDVLSQYVLVPPAMWQFERDRYGKPRLVEPTGISLEFNLSHTTGLVACAVTSGVAVGVDVEDRRRAVNVEIARDVFSAAEMDELRGLPADERQARFFDFWTLKEAYAKARGLGFVLPLAECAFRVVANEAPRVTFGPNVADDPAAWTFWRLPLGPHHTAAVACHGGDTTRLVVCETVPFAEREP
jgi:4'-phosphopantetheinyl transferase